MNLNPLSWFGRNKAPEQRYSQQQPPGQSKGILDWLRRSTGVGWPGAANARDTAAEYELRREKIHAGPHGMNLPAFLPYFDDHSGETHQMRTEFRKMMRSPVVKASTLDKIFDVASGDFHVNPPEDTGKDPVIIKKEKDIAAFCNWALTERVHGGIPGLVWNIGFGGLCDGYSVNEKVMALQDKGSYGGKYVLDKLKMKDVDNDVILLTDEYRNITGLMGMRYNAGEYFSPADFVIFEYMKIYEKPGGMSDYRAAYGPYWMLDTVEKLRMIGVEKRSLPVLWGQYRDNMSRPALEQSLAKMKLSNWLATPESVQIKALEIAGQSHQIYKETIEDLKQDIAIAILGAYLQMMGGSQGQHRGSTSEHRDTASLVKWYLQAVILEAINRQIIPDLVDLNYVGVDYPRAVMGGIDEADLLQASLVDMNLQKMGVKLSSHAIYKKYGREEPIDQADVLVPPAPTATSGWQRPAGGTVTQQAEPTTSSGPTAEQLAEAFFAAKRKHAQVQAFAELRNGHN